MASGTSQHQRDSEPSFDISTFVQKKRTFSLDASQSQWRRLAQCFLASFRKYLGVKKKSEQKILIFPNFRGLGSWRRRPQAPHFPFMSFGIPLEGSALEHLPQLQSRCLRSPLPTPWVSKKMKIIINICCSDLSFHRDIS